MGNMPGIGPKLAESMLRHFKNVRNIVNANKEELMKVEKIGPKKAEGIREVLEEEFKPD
jgi:Fanconi anemia group M protein